MFTSCQRNYEFILLNFLTLLHNYRTTLYNHIAPTACGNFNIVIIFIHTFYFKVLIYFAMIELTWTLWFVRSFCYALNLNQTYRSNQNGPWNRFLKDSRARQHQTNRTVSKSYNEAKCCPVQITNVVRVRSWKIILFAHFSSFHVLFHRKERMKSSRILHATSISSLL